MIATQLSSELDQFDPNATVVLMSLHSAKGLEFDLVFLAGRFRLFEGHLHMLEVKRMSWVGQG